MALSRQRKNVAYGLGQPLTDMSPRPIVATRNPTTSDVAELGTNWVNKSNNGAWVLTSVVAGSSTWTDVNVSAGAVITTGDLDVVAGDINVTAGDIIASAGSILVSAGDIDLTVGSVNAAGGMLASTGDIDVTNGDINIAAGRLLVSAGDIDVTLGDINIIGGDFLVTAGNIEVSVGDVALVLGDLFVNDGDLTVIAGNINTIGLFVAGDEGTGFASTVGFTNIVDAAVSTGAGKVLMKTSNPGDSSDWLKIYVGTAVRYIPLWTNLSP